MPESIAPDGAVKLLDHSDWIMSDWIMSGSQFRRVRFLRKSPSAARRSGAALLLEACCFLKDGFSGLAIVVWSTARDSCAGHQVVDHGLLFVMGTRAIILRETSIVSDQYAAGFLVARRLAASRDPITAQVSHPSFCGDASARGACDQTGLE